MKFNEEELKELGSKIGIDWSKYDFAQFKKGMAVELEHGTIDQITNVTGDDPLLTAKITLAHLNEIPDYYDRLEKMEAEAES